MTVLSDDANQRRNIIAQLMATQTMPPPLPVFEPLPSNSMSGLATLSGILGDPNYQGHSPTSSFDFATSPAASTAAIGMFDPAGSSPTMQGGAPAPTGRDAFSGTPAQDWGGVFDPSDAPTMSAPDMIASPHATPTFDVDQTGMPNAPSFDITPAAPDEQGASLTDPGPGFSSGFAAGFSSAVAGMSEGVGGMGEGGGGLGAVGGTEGSGSGDTSAGGVG